MYNDQGPQSSSWLTGVSTFVQPAAHLLVRVKKIWHPSLVTPLRKISTVSCPHVRPNACASTDKEIASLDIVGLTTLFARRDLDNN
jgi:hypothetical protein